MVFNFSGVAGIYFPVGKLKDGGTCEFADETCSLKCGAITDVPDCDKIPYEQKRDAFEYIINTNRIIVAEQIEEQMKKIYREKYSAVGKILYWFASGDCPSEFTKHITDLIKYLDKECIEQCGFTRNKELWKNIDDEVYRCKIVLTVEDKEDIESIGIEKRLYAIPDYSTGRISLYSCKNGKLQYSNDCSRNYSYHDKIAYKVPVKKRKADCRICLNKKEGCFKSDWKEDK